MLKDDKAYPFIRVSVEEDFPRVMFARKSNVISRNTETLDITNGRKVYIEQKNCRKVKIFWTYIHVQKRYMIRLNFKKAVFIQNMFTVYI